MKENTELLTDEEVELWREEVKALYKCGFEKLGDRVKRQLRAYESLHSLVSSMELEMDSMAEDAGRVKI